MAKVVASRAQIIKVSDLLREHLKEAGENLFAYDEGWNDKRVADDVTGITAIHVSKIRTDLYGRIRPAAPALLQGGVVDEARMARIEKGLAELAADTGKLSELVDEVRRLHAMLCQSISVNRLLDVRHLAGPVNLGPVVNGLSRTNGSAAHR
ncbi:hypothetical protein RA307_04925 [Xanthobacteraceae bacterium Astr-EGSB]|uniref:hypothetical protein n=1 Tax=Astrobacterium formosum TaxID=3069710 RepID=UPI0027AE3450|nr:hypothetical protein [Xanthobacteraceae bacterium Astr-EGSB]